MVTYGEASEIAPTDRMIGSFRYLCVTTKKTRMTNKIIGNTWGAIASVEK